MSQHNHVGDIFSKYVLLPLEFSELPPHIVVKKILFFKSLNDFYLKNLFEYSRYEKTNSTIQLYGKKYKKPILDNCLSPIEFIKKL